MKHHRDVWKTVGDPGTAPLDGRINGRRLTITVKAFGTLPGRDKTAVRNEAEQTGPLRDAPSVAVEFGTY